MQLKWWKILTIFLLIYTVIVGLMITVPRVPILEETIRNIFFHVCMWMAMMVFFTVSVWNAILVLKTGKLKHDIFSRQYAMMGIYFGILGYTTGVLWMLYTWADPSQSQTATFSAVAREPKLIGAALALLIYFAYLVLRDSITDIDKRAKISAVYNIFAFCFLFPFIWIVPRLLPSLHPGGDGGNPALNFKDVDANIRLVFYPAIIGWTLLGVWITTITIRLKMVKNYRVID